MPIKLRDYQEDCLNAIVKAEKKGVKRQLIVIPTGGGKTVVFAQLPLVRPNSLPMLVLAHREELLTQAKEKILQSNPGLKVEIEQGENHAADDSDVVIASVPTLGRSNTTRLKKYKDTFFKTIIVDEAHHAAAPTYKRILDYYKPSLVVGVTATPQRGDNVRLTDVFDDVTYYITIQELMNANFLSGLRGYRVASDVDISDIPIRAGDYSERYLEASINIEERNDLIVRSYKELASGLKTLAFCATVKHAEDLRDTFRKEGVTSELVVGTTESAKRSAVFEDFRRGKIEVIVNVGVLTEGFDEPSVECIILARPTRSNLLYTQIVGRGTRLHPGKQHCIVIDIADITKGKKPLGLPTLLGLPPDFDADGEDLLVLSAQYQELEAKAPTEAATVRSLQDIKLAWERIDLFTPPKPSATLLEYSNLIWTETGEGNFYLGVQRGESLNIHADALGRYHCILRGPGKSDTIGLYDDVRGAFSAADGWVKKHRADAMKLLDAYALWRSDAPTEKQIKYLKKHGVPITADMTKGDASAILDKIFKENPSKGRPPWLQKKIAAGKLKDF